MSVTRTRVQNQPTHLITNYFVFMPPTLYNQQPWEDIKDFQYNRHEKYLRIFGIHTNGEKIIIGMTFLLYVKSPLNEATPTTFYPEYLPCQHSVGCVCLRNSIYLGENIGFFHSSNIFSEK